MVWAWSVVLAASSSPPSDTGTNAQAADDDNEDGLDTLYNHLLHIPLPIAWMALP